MNNTSKYVTYQATTQTSDNTSYSFQYVQPTAEEYLAAAIIEMLLTNYFKTKTVPAYTTSWSGNGTSGSLSSTEMVVALEDRNRISSALKPLLLEIINPHIAAIRKDMEVQFIQEIENILHIPSVHDSKPNEAQSGNFTTSTP